MLTGGTFYIFCFHKLKPLMPILPLLPILCVCENLIRAHSHLTTMTCKFLSPIVNSANINHATHFILLSGMGAAPISDDKNTNIICRCRQVRTGPYIVMFSWKLTFKYFSCFLILCIYSIWIKVSNCLRNRVLTTYILCFHKQIRLIISFILVFGEGDVDFVFASTQVWTCESEWTICWMIFRQAKICTKMI